MANEIQELKFQVGEAWKGVYSSSTAYGLANVVQDPTGLSIYRSLKSGNVGHPLSNASWWFRIIDMSSIKAESDRIAALNEAIAQDEALRVAAEELRQQHEAERVAAETQRNEAEQARISAEQARVNAESARAIAEQQRITAEEGRVSAESARVTAEQARVLAETLRANAEDQRAANEQNRIAAEQQRIERAEQDHQRAESDHATYVDSLGAFDISSYHATDGVLAKYADLTAALGTNGANIPDDLRKGGMSVKFVQSSDNKYVSYFLPKDTWSDKEYDWEKTNLEKELQEIIGAPAYTIDHEITETIPRGNNPNYSSFICLAGVSYGLDAWINEATASGATNITLKVNNEQVARLDIEPPSTGINPASQGQVLQFDNDTTIDLSVWLSGDYNTSRVLTVDFKETVAKVDGRLEIVEDDVEELQGDVSTLNNNVGDIEGTVDNHSYGLKSLDVSEPYWTGKIYSQYGTYEESFVDLKAGYHYTFVARINSVHTNDIYCQIRLIQGDESSSVATFNIPQGDTVSPARYITTNGIDFGFGSTTDIGYTNRKVYLFVYCAVTVDVYIDVFATKTESDIISHNRIIKPDAFDSKSSFCTAINTAFSNYVISTGICNKVCMEVLYDTESWDDLFEKVNHNFRADVVSKDVSIVENCNRINNALDKKIYRFVDACLHTFQNYNYTSLNTSINGDEPSVIISEDGKYMYLYARKHAGWHYRFKTVDGLNWSEDLMHLDGIRRNPSESNYYLIHPNVNLIDGVYYLIGASANSGGDLQLFTSTDGLNFTYAGVIFHAGHISSSTLNVTSWGNVTLYREPYTKKWYLYYEMQDTNVPGEGWHGWEICLATCDDILYDNGDGTVGDWVESSNNPVFPYIKSINKSCGNPDFAKGCDNLPIRVDGKYYIYFHGHYNEYEDDTPGRSDLFRAYSTDLVNWEQEGMIFDNRDDPTRGVGAPGNADHCIIEWHGRTYLFYSWNINDPNNSPYIKMMVDDRPLHELLRLRP